MFDSATPWTGTHQAPLSMGFSRQEYWSGLPCFPPGYLPDPGIVPTSGASPALADWFFTTSAPWEAPASTSVNRPQAPGFPGNPSLKLPAHPPGDSALSAATLQKEEKATAFTACRRWHAKQFHPAWGVAQRFPSKQEQTKDSAASRWGSGRGGKPTASSPPHLLTSLEALRRKPSLSLVF